MATAASNVRTTLEMIKIEHTLFALPFAFLGALLAARGFTPSGLPTWWQMLWITLAMVGARSPPCSSTRTPPAAPHAPTTPSPTARGPGSTSSAPSPSTPTSASRRPTRSAPSWRRWTDAHHRPGSSGNRLCAAPIGDSRPIDDPRSDVFGQLTVTYRRRLGLTQTELARRAGLSVRTIHNLEAGRVRPRFSSVRLLADAFGLTGNERADFVEHAAAELLADGLTWR